jgi:hypothetical protein
MTEKTSKRKIRRWYRVGAGILLFGLMMGFRGTVQAVWLRAVIAGSAFAVLALALLSARRAQ